MTALSTLLSRVESESGADKELNQACLVALGELLSEPYTGRPTDPDLLTNLKAVIELVEARLPGWLINIKKHGPDRWEAFLTDQRGTFLVSNDIKRYGLAPTRARALLAALIRAEMEKAK